MIQTPDASDCGAVDVITTDLLAGVPLPEGPATHNSGYLWYYDGQYFKRQPTYDWNGPSTGAPNIPRVSDLPSAMRRRGLLFHCGARRCRKPRSSISTATS